MKRNVLRRRLFVIVVVVAFSVAGFKTISVLAQARRQPPSSDQKKNKRPPEGQQTDEQKQEPLPPNLVGKPQEAEKVTIVTNIVNVDAVVYNKKSGGIVTGLKKDNFAIFVDGVKKDITNFSTPEAPITVALVVEYSKLGEMLGLYGNGGMEAGQMEVIRPTAMRDKMVLRSVCMATSTECEPESCFPVCTREHPFPASCIGWPRKQPQPG